MAFSALSKHILKTGLQKDLPKTLFLSICESLALNAGQKFMIKKKIALVSKLRLWNYI